MSIAIVMKKEEKKREEKKLGRVDSVLVKVKAQIKTYQWSRGGTKVRFGHFGEILDPWALFGLLHCMLLQSIKEWIKPTLFTGFDWQLSSVLIG